jgi:hypothetical protein
MRKQRKIRPPKVNKVIEETSNTPLHLLFPVHLSYTDGKEHKDCFFKDEVDFKKFITRHKIKDYEVKTTEPRD